MILGHGIWPKFMVHLVLNLRLPTPCSFPPECKATGSKFGAVQLQFGLPRRAVPAMALTAKGILRPLCFNFRTNNSNTKDLSFKHEWRGWRICLQSAFQFKIGVLPDPLLAFLLMAAEVVLGSQPEPWCLLHRRARVGTAESETQRIE